LAPERFDIIIIGTGAGGGTLAHRLAPSGKRILLIERGDCVPREKANWSPRAVNVEGNTKFYGAALFRLRRDDFREVRHYMGHVNSVLMALSKCPNPTVFQKTLAVNDFYFGSKEWPHPIRHISFVGKLDGETLSAGAPAIAPGWTLDLMARHSLDFWLTSEDLPDPDNRVMLDREGKVVLRYTPNNGEGHRRLIVRLKDLMRQQTICPEHGHECHQGMFARNLYVGQRIPLAGVAHQNGTVRFGRDPKTSALDVHCRAHDLDNLYVVDGGFFPSSAAVNPALTIMANALRVGDHLLERMR
jgi:choline dehydrogenase-like flavoprotein